MTKLTQRNFITTQLLAFFIILLAPQFLSANGVGACMEQNKATCEQQPNGMCESRGLTDAELKKCRCYNFCAKLVQ
jgi:hypothetical protein